MISRFFIDRPIFANVIAVITVVLGVVALWRLPVERYPQITPPTVRVSTTYPGANAQVVADTVAAPIEQQVNGVKGMTYLSSTSSSDGSYTLTVTFEIGTDLDVAQVLVQNRVAIAEPTLPEEVRRQGVAVRQQSSSIVLSISLTSPGGTHDALFLSNYATLRLRDELTRVPGVGDVNVSGAGAYSMRVWMDNDQLRSRGLTTQDVIAALQEQNVQVAAGQIGQPPIGKGTEFQYVVTSLGRLSEAAQFEQIIVRSEGTRVTRLRDVARVELGAQTYDQYSVRTGRPAASVLIYQLPGSNALDVAREVRAAMERLSKKFPEDLEYAIPFDTTLFVQQAVNEVYRTLIEAGVLVLIVILVFLQDWRATLVPATTVPVTIIGAFAVMPLLGFSINLLTLFGLVLAIGIVVDDAIIIVENAAHHIDQGMTPRDATIKAMNEVTGPVLAFTAVQMAVFVPTVFLGGITGQLYRQFALTIAATALISAVNALTLKPAQAASYLRRSPARRNPFARAFNAAYGLFERGYAWLIGRLVRHPGFVLMPFAGLLLLTYVLYQSQPTGFLPTEDQGYAIVNVQLPDAAAQQRTREVTDRLDGVFGDTPGVDNWVVLGGFSLLDATSSPNAAACYVIFSDWSVREREGLTQEVILARLRERFGEIEEANVTVFAPPAIQGLGTTGGFQMQIQDREGVGMVELQRRTEDVIDLAQRHPDLGPTSTTFRASVPQLYADVDRTKVKSQGLRLSDVFGTLQASLGSAYVNDFNRFGRTYQVRVQSDAPYRNSPEDIGRLEVRNSAGEMVPLGSVARVERRVGPPIITRYNLYPSSAVIGAAKPGASTGEALTAMEQIAQEQLPPSMGYEWTGIAYQERRVTGQALLVFGLSVLLVYLVLAAQYESWLLPLAVILVVPLGLLGAVLALSVRGMPNDVYAQIGAVLIVALASKNAILIVEFARELRLHGRSILDAAVEAARLRLRPIVMTSFAFILGVVPLVRATGAGAASRQSLGTAVLGGMLASTVLAVVIVPVFYVAVQSLIEVISGPPKQPAHPTGEPTPLAPGGAAQEREGAIQGAPT